MSDATYRKYMYALKAEAAEMMQADASSQGLRQGRVFLNLKPRIDSGAFDARVPEQAPENSVRLVLRVRVAHFRCAYAAGSGLAGVQEKTQNPEHRLSLTESDLQRVIG